MTSICRYSLLKMNSLQFLYNMLLYIYFGYDRAIIDRVMPLGLKTNSNYLQFSLIFVAEIEHT